MIIAQRCVRDGLGSENTFRIKNEWIYTNLNSVRLSPGCKVQIN
jgi:hypothetical protein